MKYVSFKVRVWTSALGLSRISFFFSYEKRTKPIAFEGQDSEVKVTHLTLLINVETKYKDRFVSAGTVKLGIHTCTFYGKRTTSTDFQGQGSKFKVTS